MRNIVSASPSSRRAAGALVPRGTRLLLALLYFSPFCHPATLAAQSPDPISVSAASLDETRSVTMSGNVRPETLFSSSTDLGAAPADLALEHIVLLLKRSPEQEAALKNDSTSNRIGNRRNIIVGLRPPSLPISSECPPGP